MVDSKVKENKKELSSLKEKVSSLDKKNVGGGSSSTYFPTFRRAGSAVKKASVATVTGMSPYYWLLIFGGIDLIAKNYVAYEKISSSIISFFTALIFYLLIRKTSEAKLKESLIIGALVLDIGLSFGLLKIPLGSIVEGPLIAIHVFIWVALAAILFFMGISDTLGAGRKLPKLTWVILIVFIVVLFPLLLDSYSYQYDIRQSEYFEIAVEEVKKMGVSLEKTKNFWVDYATCFGNFITKPDSDFEDCLEDERIARFCKANFEKDQQKECITDEKRKLSGEEGYAQGAVSDIIKKVFKAKLAIPDVLFPKRPDERRLEYPIDLRIENQRELEGITGEASCVFTKRKEKILGDISITDEEGNTFEVPKSSESSFRINCKPSEDLELGRYKVNYKVTLHGLSTFSLLTKAFVNKDLSETEIKQIKNDYFSRRDDCSSQAPKDLARMNFAFGKPDPDPKRRCELNPIIKSDEIIPFVTTFENVGRGKIVAVNSYSAETILERGFGIAKGEYDCLEYGEVSISIPVSGKTFHKSCDLELPDDLKNVEKYKIITFKLDFNYDYELDDEESTTIIEKPGEEETEEEGRASE